MAISTTIIKNSYSGDGSNDTFAYQFKITAEADLQVIIRSAAGTETVKTLTTHYTVTGVGTASGGNVVFTAGNIPTATETVVIRRSTTQTQTLDLVENDPFTADSVEGAFDKNLAIAQELQEQIDRSIKISRTNTMTSTDFTTSASERASKILAFDTSGEISVTQELGTYRGTDTTVTTEAYVQRDIVKSTTAGQLNNVYICVADAVVGDSLTDTDHFELLVDAVSAATSATSAATSASAAATSATNAATSASNASTSATNAATSETNAGTSATNAASSATAAASSATSAASSATTATTKASEASTSATNAATSETNAGTSETNAATSATNAASSATAAASSATSASGSATTATTKASEAATSATNAATSETNAATSATNAATSATNAATSATNAAASYDDFDDRYLGAKSSAPTVDNDGDALITGALYFDTTANEMRVYNGSSWASAGSAVNGTSGRFVYTATAGQTTFSGADDNGETLAYDTGFIDVYLNGVKMVNGTDVTVTSGTSVVFASGVALNDIVEMITYGAFNLASFAATAITSGTLNTARIADGSITNAKLATPGVVLQVLQTVKTDVFSTTSNGFHDIVSVSITPTSSSNKILIHYDCNASSEDLTMVKLLRDSTDIGIGDASGSRTRVTQGGQFRGGNNDKVTVFSGSFLDSPSSTSSVTYKLQVYKFGGTTMKVNAPVNDSDGAFTGRGITTITVMEIAG